MVNGTDHRDGTQVSRLSRFRPTAILAATAVAITSFALPVLPPVADEFFRGGMTNAPTVNAVDEPNHLKRVNPLTSPDVPGTRATVMGTSPASLPGQAGVTGPAIRTVVSRPLAPAPVNDKGAGDYAALPGTSSGTWGSTGQTGGFTWNYPLSVRQSPAGPSPALGFSYDSTKVDGLTSATNNQASALGDGWTLSGAGRISQKFTPCSDQGIASSYDMCGNPGGQSISISFGGRSGQIIKDVATGNWKLAKDDNSKVEYLTASGSNGTFDGGYWKITDTSGTQYFFGRNRLPGWASGKPSTNSVETMPVGAATGTQPCAGASFGASLCQQAVGWNLDYVVDVHGNSQANYYSQVTNYYKAQAGTGSILPFIRSSRLERIDYSMRAGSELTATAPLRIRLEYANRCTGIDCTAGTDVPTGLTCPAAGPCTVQSPTFYIDHRLTAVHAETLLSGTYQAADKWNLNHSMPNPGDGTKPALWLGSVEHQGLNTQDGQTPITDPPVTFAGQTLQNRVWVTDGLAPLNRYRLTSIKTVTGATIAVSYNGADCTPTSLPASPETNTRRCYPAWWTPTTPVVQAARMDWFHIYPVATITVDAGPGGTGSPSQLTRYQYLGSPAWTYPEPTYRTGTAGSKQTWSIAAGWSQVKAVTSGSTTITTYLRGLDKTPSNASGGLRAATVTASDGTTVPDSIWFSGHTLETQNLTSENGTLLTAKVTIPWASAPTATGPVALGTPTARQQGTARNWAKSAIDTGWRTTESLTYFDSLGRAKAITNSLDTAVTGDDTCTTTTYADGTAANLLALPAQTATYAGACSGTGIPAGAIVKSEQIMFDASTAAVPGSAGYSAPTKGNVTNSRQAKAVAGTGVTAWQNGPTLAYDVLGRVTTSTDSTTGSPRTTTTAYSPATGLPTTVVVTNSVGWTETTTLDGTRGQIVTAADANGSTTSSAYDANGRVTATWDPTRPKATNPVPTTATTYSVSQTQPSWIKTAKVNFRNSPVETYEIYDGLGRLRQTQSPSVQNGTITTDTLYANNGLKALERHPYYITTAPDGALKVPTVAVPSSTDYQYDAAGRVIKTRKLAFDNQEQWATTVAYAGTNSVTTTGPGNDPATTVITDMAGKTTARKVYPGTTATGTPATTTYTYSPLQQMTGMTDAAGNAWTWAFDPLGRQTSATDPDTGTTTTGYDTSGRASTTTNALGTVTTTVFDALDRATKVSTAVSTQPVKTLLTHTYDTEKKGQLASSTRYNGPNQDQAVTTDISGYNANYQPGSVKITLPAAMGALAGVYETKTTYGKSGLPAYVTHPAIGGLPSEAVSNSYNDFDLPATLSSQFGTTYAGGSQYDNLNNMAVYGQYDNKLFADGTDTMGSTSVYLTWDHTTGRLDKMQASNDARDTITDLGTTAYSYEASGQLTSRDLSYASRPGGTAAADYQCYTYDKDGRLAGAWTPSSKNCTGGFTATGLGGAAPYAQKFTYNTAGNLTNSTRYTAAGAVSSTEDYTYPGAGTTGPHRLQNLKRTNSTGTVTNNAISWDTAGRLTGRAGQTLAYTPDGKIASITGTSTIARNPNPAAALGTTRATGTASASQRYYSPDGALVGITDGTGTTATVGNATAFRTTAGATSATRTFTFAGKTVAQRTAAPGASTTTTAFIIGDSVNTAQVITTATTGGGTGPITTIKRNTDPAGLTRGATQKSVGQTAFTAAPAGATSPGSNAANPSGFSSATGYLTGTADTASTLTHLGARDYDPVLGIFTAPDPVLNLAEAKNFSPYLYANGDPVNDSDPSGLAIRNRMNDSDGGGGWDGHIYQSVMASTGVHVPYFAAPPTFNPLPRHIPRFFAPTPPPQPKASSSLFKWELLGAVVGVAAGIALCAGTIGLGCIVAGAAIASSFSTAGWIADQGRQVDLAEAGGHFLGDAALGIVPFCRGGICKIAGKEIGKSTEAFAIKAGSSGGVTSGLKFPRSVKQEVLRGNPSTCVYCRMETKNPQIDHAIPRSRGGNATLDNGQTTCQHCNGSKNSRDFPVNPPPGYRGEWPPLWWGKE